MAPISSLLHAARTGGTRLRAVVSTRPLLCAVLLSAVIAAGFAFSLSPGYETNDDVGMQQVVDGGLGEPLPHLVFSNVLVGLLLRALYRAADWFPWYGSYLYLVHFTALLAIVYVVLADRRDHLQLRLLALAGVLAVFHLSMWMQLQFTSTALLFGASGVVLYTAVARRDPTRWAAIAAGGAMVGFSSWIRWQSAQAVVLLALPIFVLTLRRVPWRRLAVFAGTAAAIVLAGSLYQALYYSGQADWQEYFHFNSVRGQLLQSAGLGRLDPAILAEVGWTENDLAMFRNWFFTAEDVYQAGDLDTIASALPASFTPRKAAAVVADQARGWLGGLRLAVIATLAGLAWIEGGRRGRQLVLASIVAFPLVAFVLAGVAKLPARVAVPMLAFLALLLLAAPHAEGEAGSSGGGKARRAWRILAVAVSVAAVVGGAVAARDLDQRHHTADAALRKVLSPLETLDPEGVVVAWGGQLPVGTQSLSPWRRGGLGGPALLPLGWQARSPMHEAWMAGHGINDLYAAIATREDVYLPLGDPALGRLYLRYLQEHYGFSGLLRPVARAGRLTVYDLVVTYDVDDRARALTERRLDGSSVVYPLDVSAVAGEAVALLSGDGSLVIVGRAAADLIVVTARGQAISLVLPTRSNLAEDTALAAFQVTVPRDPEDLRVFALSGSEATEITP